MALVLYNLFIRLYVTAIQTASLFNPKARLFLKGRQNLFPNIQQALSSNQAPIAWFHCASLGEFEQCRPVLEQFKKKSPHYKIFLTFFSPSGYEVRKNYPQADYIFYLPMDTLKNVDLFYQIVDPSLVFFVKYEFWHHFIKGANDRKTPIILFSAIFRAHQIFFKPYGVFFKHILLNFDHIFVQDSHSFNLLQKINVNNVSIAGDTRFDRVAEICNQSKEIPVIEKFKSNKKVLVAGSTWPEDMDVLYDCIKHFTHIKFIIAPHEISENIILEIEKRIKQKTIRFSQANEQTDMYDVLIIDNIGMLSSIYKYADYAYIGGAFGKGLHNILEAATYGVPVFFGNKNYQKFKEANDLLKQGGAFTVNSSEGMAKSLSLLEGDSSKSKKASDVCSNYVKTNTGASDHILNYIWGIMKVNDGR